MEQKDVLSGKQMTLGVATLRRLISLGTGEPQERLWEAMQSHCGVGRRVGPQRCPRPNGQSLWICHPPHGQRAFVEVVKEGI